jgi:hypothetical protein
VCVVEVCSKQLLFRLCGHGAKGKKEKQTRKGNFPSKKENQEVISAGGVHSGDTSCGDDKLKSR